MSKIVFSNEAMQYIRAASNLLHVDIIDCIVANDDWLIFVIKKGQLGKAIGPKARKLEKLKKTLKKNIKFVEFDEDPERFIVNLFKPYKIQKLNLKDYNGKSVAYVQVNPREKSKIIGKNGRNIEAIRELANRHHSINDVQIK